MNKYKETHFLDSNFKKLRFALIFLNLIWLFKVGVAFFYNILNQVYLFKHLASYLTWVAFILCIILYVESKNPNKTFLTDLRNNTLLMLFLLLLPVIVSAILYFIYSI